MKTTYEFDPDNATVGDLIGIVRGHNSSDRITKFGVTIGGSKPKSITIEDNPSVLPPRIPTDSPQA